ncbi:MAG: RluA family pseudouridine synthase [Patescibacteria group bacterium]|mgnify:CR=1 FL=1
MKIIIPIEQVKQRLDKFLACGQLYSRQQAQKLIKQGLITVNNKTVSQHYLIKEKDLITINDNWEILSKEKTAVAQPIKLSQEPLNILAETKEYIVINKPAGLVVHGKTSDTITLSDILADQYPKLIKVGDDPDRPGIVHRLDKDVSGLMVIAKTQDSFDNLKNQFKQRKIIKKYTALVYGQINLDSGAISFPIRRSQIGFKMAALPLTKKGQPNQDGRLAITEFSVLKNFINYTLLKIKIKTGRTHQIRVHLSAYDHPIVGDDIYGTVKTRAQNKKIGLNRIFLIADELSFIDIAGNEQKFAIPMTDQLKNLLEKIK